MRILFTIDTKDYNIKGTVFERPSARGIIIKDNKVAMVHSTKYNYYKFPGGGIEKEELKEEALIREVREETGLEVISSKIREYGMVHRIQKGDYEDVFIQDNYYYLCNVKDIVNMQKLDDYEKDEGFTLEWISPEKAMKVNSENKLEMVDKIMLEREVRVIEMLIREGYLS